MVWEKGPHKSEIIFIPKEISKKKQKSKKLNISSFNTLINNIIYVNVNIYIIIVQIDR